MCAEKQLKDEHLLAVDIDLDSNFVIAGAIDEYTVT